MNRYTVLVDGDDTLWHSQELFDDAYVATSDVLREAGLEVDSWSRLVTAADVKNVRTMGFTPERFAVSCSQAYEALAVAQHAEVDASLLSRIQGIASNTFRIQPRNVDNVDMVLTQLRDIGKVVLYTRGDEKVQRARIDGSGLAASFDDVVIVADKTVDVLANVMVRLGMKPEASSSIGDSFRSDIDPALQLGLHAVWVNHDTWQYERDCVTYEHDSLDVAAHLYEVPPLIHAATGRARERST